MVAVMGLFLRDVHFTRTAVFLNSHSNIIILMSCVIMNNLLSESESNESFGYFGLSDTETDVACGNVIVE